jgi:hypothetical protein
MNHTALPLAHFFEQGSVALARPLILANLLEVMNLVAKAVLLIVHWYPQRGQRLD